MISPNFNPLDIEMVSFDLWKTLIQSNATPNRQNRADALYDLFQPSIDREAFAAVVQEADVTADNLAETEPRHYGPKERIALIAHTIGAQMLTDTEFTDFYAAQSERFFRYPPTLIDSTMPELFRQINETGRQIAIVSNTGFVNGREMRTALTLSGLPLERVSVGIFSDEVGINKPHSAIFEHLAETAGVSAARILHIGDNKRADYDGALAAGFQAAHISEQPTASDIIRLVIGEGK